jgi:hypothetical protein
MNFTYFKGRCPVCNGVRKDCRQSKITNLVHCRADLSIVPPGWQPKGQDQWGFEMYAESSEQLDSVAWRLRQQERELQRQREKEELTRGALPPADRDKAIRRIHRYFGLALLHRQNLRARGLCDVHIDRLPYFSFHSGAVVPQFTPASLPGVRRGKLAVKESGFACPIPNIDGLIIGWQNRFDNTEGGKYRWPVGEMPAHLPNGELPLGVYRPDSGVTRLAIGHSEGFLKADIIAQLWGLPTLGAASANFAATPEQHKQSLDRLSIELGTTEVHWFADAGAVANPNVTSQYLKSWEKLALWGYSVKVVWYGQIEKSIGDADEISQEVREKARLITISEYLAIALKHGGIRENLSSHTTYIDEIDTLQEEPDSDAYAAYTAHEQEQEQFEGQQISLPTAEDLWKLLHVPDEMQFSKRLTLSDKALQADFLCVKAPMGSGKTYTMAQVCQEANSLLIVVNTIALGEALARRYCCIPYNHEKIKSGALSISDIDRLVITSESLWKIRTFNKRFDVVLIDEADQVLSSAVASVTTRRKRQEILTNLEYFSHQSKQFVLMDADLSSPVVDFGQYICGRKPYTVQNASIPHTGEIFYQFESQDAHFTHICNLLEADETVLIVADSKKKVKSLGAYFSGWENIEGVENLEQRLYERLQEEFPDKKGVIIHGDNSGKDEIRDLIKRINELLPVLKLDYLIFNSCVQSGVSIEVVNSLGQGYFQNLCCLFTGMTLPHTELGQVSHRWRPTDCEKSFSFAQTPTPRLETSITQLERDLFAQTPTPRLETSITQLERDLFANYWEEVQSLGIDAKSGIPDPEVTKFRIQVEARRNWSLNNIQDAFTRHLLIMGYEIVPHPEEEFITGTDTFKEALKSRGEVIDKALVATIINSPLLNQKAYEQLEKKPNPDYYDRALKIRYELNDFTGMEPTEKLVKMWLEDDIHKKLTRLDFLFQPKQAAVIADLANRRKYHYAFDQRHNLLERQLLESLNAKAYLDPNKVYTNADLKPLEVACKAQASKIKRLLGVTIYQPPQYLKRGLKEAAEGVKALFDVSIFPLAKWILGTLSRASSIMVTNETFKEQESATEVCKQLSIPGQIICEAKAIAVRHKVSDMSPSKVHAALCEAVGLRREVAIQNAQGRGYRIKAESWDFAMVVLAHRAHEREERIRQREEAIAERASRFDPSDVIHMQRVIEAEIQTVIASTSIPPSPDLVYSQTPPEIYQINNLGGVCESQLDEQEYSPQPVNVGDEISVPCLGQTGTIAAISPGRDAEFNFHDYIRFLPNGCSAKWIPWEWVQSLDGRSIRPNPIPDPSFIPLRTRETWANWLLAITDPKQLHNFERRRTVAEISQAISTLSAVELLELQHKFAGWGIERSWLPPIDHTQSLISVLKLGLEMGVEALKEYLCDMLASLDGSLLRRTWQSLSHELKSAIVSLAPEAPGMLLT